MYILVHVKWIFSWWCGFNVYISFIHIIFFLAHQHRHKSCANTATALRPRAQRFYGFSTPITTQTTCAQVLQTKRINILLTMNKHTCRHRRRCLKCVASLQVVCQNSPMHWGRPYAPTLCMSFQHTLQHKQHVHKCYKQSGSTPYWRPINTHVKKSGTD